MLRRQEAAFGDEASLVFLPSVVCVFRVSHFSFWKKRAAPILGAAFVLLHISAIESSP
jgi:hypothetical protein